MGLDRAFRVKGGGWRGSGRVDPQRECGTGENGATGVGDVLAGERTGVQDRESPFVELDALGDEGRAQTMAITAGPVDLKSGSWTERHRAVGGHDGVAELA